jgi:hypothetical protein
MNIAQAIMVMVQAMEKSGLSGGFTMVVIEHTAKAFAAMNWPVSHGGGWPRSQLLTGTAG